MLIILILIYTLFFIEYSSSPTVKVIFFIIFYLYFGYLLFQKKQFYKGKFSISNVFILLALALTIFVNEINSIQTFIGHQLTFPAFVLLIGGFLGFYTISNYMLKSLRKILFISSIFTTGVILNFFDEFLPLSSILLLLPIFNIKKDFRLDKMFIFYYLVVIFYSLIVINDRTYFVFFSASLLINFYYLFKKKHIVLLSTIAILSILFLDISISNIDDKFFIDTRSFLVPEVLSNLNSTADYVFGKGIDSRYFSDWFFNNDNDSSIRINIEIGILSLLYKSGAIFSLLFLFKVFKLINKNFKVLENKIIGYILITYIFLFLVSLPLKLDVFNLTIAIILSHSFLLTPSQYDYNHKRMLE